MKILLYSNENIYQDIHNFYLEIDENNEIIRNDFDRNFSDIFHINDPKFINYAINRIDGMQNVTDIIIQKTMFKNIQLMRILFRFKFFNPDVHVILYMDDDPIYYEVLFSRIAKHKLCNIVTSPLELEEIWTHNYEQDLEHYILSKEKKSLLKEFQRY